MSPEHSQPKDHSTHAKSEQSRLPSTRRRWISTHVAILTLFVLCVVFQLQPAAFAWGPLKIATVLVSAVLVFELLAPMFLTDVVVEGPVRREEELGVERVRIELPSQTGKFELTTGIARGTMQLVWLGIWGAWIFVLYFVLNGSWGQVILGTPPLAVITWVAATSWIPLKLLSRVPKVDGVPFIELSREGLSLSPDLAVHARMRATLGTAPASQFFSWSDFSRIRFEPEYRTRGRPSEPAIHFIATGDRFRFSTSNLHIPLTSELRVLNPSIAEILANVSGLPVEVSEARLLLPRR